MQWNYTTFGYAERQGLQSERQNSNCRSCAPNVEDEMPTLVQGYEGVAYFKCGGPSDNGCPNLW